MLGGICVKRFNTLILSVLRCGLFCFLYAYIDHKLENNKLIGPTSVDTGDLKCLLFRLQLDTCRDNRGRRLSFSRMKTAQILCSCWAFFCPFSWGYSIGPDGLCPTIGVIPFTNNGSDHPVTNNLGYSQLAALTLAIKHFNARESTVVPELRRLSRDVCNVTLENPLNVDSQNGGHNAATVMITGIRDGNSTTYRTTCAGKSFALFCPQSKSMIF